MGRRKKGDEWIFCIFGRNWLYSYDSPLKKDW
jgi:hypothetical protein